MVDQPLHIMSYRYRDLRYFSENEDRIVRTRGSPRAVGTIDAATATISHPQILRPCFSIPSWLTFSPSFVFCSFSVTLSSCLFYSLYCFLPFPSHYSISDFFILCHNAISDSSLSHFFCTNCYAFHVGDVIMHILLFLISCSFHHILYFGTMCIYRLSASMALLVSLIQIL